MSKETDGQTIGQQKDVAESASIPASKIESISALEHAPAYTVVRSQTGKVYESRDHRVGETDVYLRYWFTPGVQGGKPSYTLIDEAPFQVLFVPEG